MNQQASAVSVAVEELTWDLCPLSDFPQVAEAWQQLNQVGPNLPVLDADFYQLLIDEFATGDEQIAICRSNDRVVAAVVVERSRRGVWQTFQPSQAPLGAWLQDPKLPVETVLAALAKQLPGTAMVLGVTQLDPDLQPRPDDSRRLRTLDYIRTASVPVTGEFADYWAARGRNLRQNIKRQRNRLKREAIATRLEVITASSDMAAAIDEFGLLESQGWKAAKGTALHPDNRQGRFYRSLMKRYAESSEAIVYRYYYGESMVATDLCLHRDGVVIIIKTTHDETQKSTSPALLMRHEAFDLIFSDGSFKKIEFYGRLMDWHEKWTSEIRTMYHANFYRSSAVAAVVRMISARNAPAD